MKRRDFLASLLAFPVVASATFECGAVALNDEEFRFLVRADIQDALWELTPMKPGTVIHTWDCVPLESAK